MTDNIAHRRGHGEDAIYFDAAKNRYVGAISVGFGPDGKRIRRKVSGRTKAEVRDKLKAVHNELDRGLHTSAARRIGHCFRRQPEIYESHPSGRADDHRQRLRHGAGGRVRIEARTLAVSGAEPVAG
jgi:hypothetical protein